MNPELEAVAIAPVEELKQAIAKSQCLVIASPEYAHGISGVMKNALDWLVSGEEFVYKPIMLINTSPRAYHAEAALKEVLVTMSGAVIESACVSLPLLGSTLDVSTIVKTPALSAPLKEKLLTFYDSISCEF